MNIDDISLKMLCHALEAGLVTSEELVGEYSERIEREQAAGKFGGAIVTVNPHARSDAKHADGYLRKHGQTRGPLHGVPIVLKDNIDTKGLRTTVGSEAGLANVPSRDAAVVTNLRRAGAVILAKTAMADFGTSFFSTSSLSGSMPNPYDLTRDSGGSSAGSALAVVKNLAAAALGGDTGGSVRVPAAFCGLVGVRPSLGSVSRRGIVPLLRRQDTIGPMGRSVGDVTRLLSAMSSNGPLTGMAGEPLALRRPWGLRVGVIHELVESIDSQEEVVEAFEAARRRMSEAGVKIVTLSWPDIHLRLTKSSLYLLRSADDISSYLERSTGIPYGTISEIYQSGHYPPSSDLFVAIVEHANDPERACQYELAVREQRRLRTTALQMMARDYLDFLFFPSVRVVAPLRDDLLSGKVNSLTFPTNTLLASQAGLPAISLPGGFVKSGLPVGMELVGRPGSDRALLSVAAVFEKAMAD